MRIRKNVLFAVASLLVAWGSTLPAAASDHGFYAGGSYGSSSFRDTCGESFIYGRPLSCDDSDRAWKVFAGYQFHRNWGLEVAWVDLGASSFEYREGTFVASATSSLEGITVAATGTVPLTDHIALFAKAGVYLWQGDDELRSQFGADSSSSSGQTQVAGVGARVRLGGHFALRAEYERYFSGDEFFGSGTDVDVSTVGVVVEF